MNEEERKKMLEDIDEYRSQILATQAGLPEAGGICFCTVFMNGIPLNVTARAATPFDAINSLHMSLKLAKRAFGLELEKPLPPQAPAPKPDPAAEVVRNDNPALAKQFEADVLEVPDPPKGKTWEIFEADRLVILPQPDEKVTLEFYAGTDKYPKVKVNKWPWEGAQGLLRHVTSADVSKPAILSCKCKVYWTEGKQFTMDNGKTGHYKDVAHIRPM